MKRIRRVVVVVVDGLGIGAQADAGKYGDEGANTLGHVWEQAHPNIPNLTELGLLAAAGLSSPEDDEPIGCYGRMIEKAAGKDTISGHWELAGLTLSHPFPTYPNGFPPEVIEAFEAETGMGVIGNKAASGTEIIQELGNEHIRTGKLIVYTSADSVFQIAAHEGVVPPLTLYNFCRDARRVLKGAHCVGRVIARPFVGERGEFTRTANRRDFAVDPFDNTLLDLMKRAHYDVIGIGKIEDIFNGRGLTYSDHANGNAACTQAIIQNLQCTDWRGLLMANLVDTDTQYGHRNDVEGFARSLEAFDQRIPEILKLLGDDGVLVITADHGCDPTFPGTDHTREQVPLLVWGLPLQESVSLGTRASFADLSATILEAFGVNSSLSGTSFYHNIAL